MSPSAWPAAVPFDPDAGGLPSDLEALFEHPAAAVPAVLLLASPAARVERQWAGRVAVSLAAAWADRGRRVVLADLCLESPELHELVGEANLEGIADIFLFGASLRHVAKPVVGSLFFTPAGPPVPDPAEVLAHPRWERLVAGFGEAQATMLLYVAAGSAGLETLAARVGRAVVLSTPGEELAATSSLPADCKIAAVLWPPAPVEEAAPEAAAPAAVPAGVESAAAPPAEVRATPPVAAEPEPALAEPTFVQRQPKRRRRVSPVLWLGLVLALGGGGWFTAQEYFPETQGYLSRVIRQIPFLGGADSGTPASAAAAATAPQPTPPPARTPIESPIPYSVAIEAHQSLAIAQERVDALREAEPQILFYIAPLLLDSVIYYRLLAGPAPDSAAAVTLMARLVQAGHKSAMDGWAVRPTTWSYQLGDFETRAAADARAQELTRQGIPVYVVEIPYTAGPPRYRLYGGAFEGPAQAELMGHLLRKAGMPTSLVKRTGRPIS